jgi:meso-butanediol dehydrogenase/(S,S)-butanediol dehydrogenase/diacetyl reductase
MDLAPGRIALVTGAGAGFGLAIARRLREAGARIALVDVDAGRLQRAAGELGAGTLTIQADVTSRAAIESAVTRCTETFGGLDTLVVSAGVIHVKDLADVGEADWDRVLDVNLKGAFLTMQAAAPPLRASGRGRIVAIGSDASKRGFGGIAAYCASKFGLVGLVESLAAELAADQVTVNCVCPVGCPTTEMGRALAEWKARQTGRPVEEVVASAGRTNPLGRNATEDDVASAVLYFVSEAGSFLTGVALDVDGGASLGSLPAT